MQAYKVVSMMEGGLSGIASVVNLSHDAKRAKHMPLDQHIVQ